MRESHTALQQLRGQKEHHEQALEAAMEAIRLHTQAVEALEQDIEVIETAMACTAASTGIEVEEISTEDEFETAVPTEVRHVSEVRMPRPPPLRPVPMARAVGER